VEYLPLQATNKKKIKVTLQTKITMDSETEKYELVTFGNKFLKGPSLYLQYEEENDAGKTQTTLKYKEYETLILRNGSVKMRQLFRKDETTNGHYESVFGTLGMLTHTKAATHHWDEKAKEGVLFLCYDMQIQGSDPGQYEMTITYKEEV
jgi:uncharacterized beta-barrel protein YwiB (DUF1934 family)